MGYQCDQGSAPGCDFAGGGVYAASHNESAREAWIFAVLYLFHLEKYEAGAHRILHGAYRDRGFRIFSAESLAEYAGHSVGISATWRTAGIHDPADSGCYAGLELWNLWAGVRAWRKSPD